MIHAWKTPERLNVSISARLYLLVTLLVMIVGCSRTDEKSMQVLLDKLSLGPEAELPSMIYGYKQSSAGAQKVLLGMLKAVRSPSPQQPLKYEASRRSGRFTMVVAHAPWHKGPYAYEYQPIIICHEEGHDQVVGYVLPFDDIYQLLPSYYEKNIGELNEWYIRLYGSHNAAIGKFIKSK
jgi:hypothetical protein